MFSVLIYTIYIILHCILKYLLDLSAYHPYTCEICLCTYANTCSSASIRTFEWNILLCHVEPASTRPVKVIQTFSAKLNKVYKKYTKQVTVGLNTKPD